MKKTQNFVMRQVIDEYVMVPRGETVERINGPMTLSETAAFIYEHLEEVKTPEEMAELLGKEYNISGKEILEDVKEVLVFLEKNEAMIW